MKKILSRTALVLGIVALSACASNFRSDVSTFHELTAPGGERVVLTPMNPEKKDSLEYRQYADVLAQSLSGYGYKETGEDEPELIAGFDVTINDGREKLYSRPGFGPYPYWNAGYWSYGRYWRSPFFGGGFRGGFGGFGGFGGGFGNNDIVARTVYKATLTLELRKPDGTLVFEGRAETETRRNDLPKVMPLLAEALFQDFPGNSGKTRRVVVERDKIQAAN